MNILVIANYFAPMNSVGAQRPNSWARHWPDRRHTVVVLTTPKKEIAKTEIFGKAVLVKEVGLNSRPQVEKQTIKNENPDKARNSIKGNLIEFHRWLRRRIFCNFLDPRSFWVSRAVSTGKSLVQAHHIDAIVSTTPAYPVHVVAARLKKAFPDLIWLADYRDLWSGNPLFPGSEIFRKIERVYERRVLSRADIVTTVSLPLAKHLAWLLDRNSVEIIPNGFEKEDIRIASQERSKNTHRGQPVRLVYTGAILKGLYNVEPLYEAICRLHELNKLAPGTLVVEFYGDVSEINKYLQNNPVLKQYIKCKAGVSRQEVLSIQSAADILLFFGARPNSGAATDGVVSGKIFEYMTAGTEIMAVGVTKEMVVGEMIEKSGTGVIYGEDSELVAERLYQLVIKGKSNISPNLKYIEKFRRDMLAEQMVKLLEDRASRIK